LAGVVKDGVLAGIDATYDHVAIAEPSILRLLTFYRDTLGGVFRYGEVLDIGAVVMTLDIGGSKVELMAPTPGSTFFDQFFASTAGRGGVHHMTFRVPDLRVAMQVLQGRGVMTFGLAFDDYWSEVFVHPRDNGGVLVQLAQVGPNLTDILTLDIDVLLTAAGH
jgi:methylmalonyl-CoA epimerase